MDYQLLAQNLRKPEGDFGRQVGEQMNKGNRIINLLTIERLQPSANDQILEVGMGNGYFCRDVITLKPGITYTGADFSADMVNEATRLNKDLVDSGKARFVLATVENLHFPDSSFHSIFTLNTIYFWEDPDKALQELKRVLRTNGKLLISIRSKKYMETLPFSQYGFRMYDNEEIKDLLIKNGFKNVSFEEITEPEQEFNGKKVIFESVIFQGFK